MKRIFMSIALMVFAFNVQAATLAPGQYQLLDHPDSGLTNVGAGITYGLRIDALGGSAANRTFSTQQDGARVILDWDGSVATLSGQVSNNATNELYDLSYILDPTTSVANGFNVVDSIGIEGLGSLTSVNNPLDTILLTGAASQGIIFSALADGYRCDDPRSGEQCINGDETAVARGWLNVNINGDEFSRDKYTNDFLVQLTPVPLPAALPLLVTGLLGFSAFSRKKSTS